MPMYPFCAWRRATWQDASMLYERVYENVRRRREGEKEEVKIPRDALASSYLPSPLHR